MILVLNKKPGVGCSTIAYNIAKLFSLPLYVYNSSYYYDDNPEDSTLYNNIKSMDLINEKTTYGVCDIGSSYSSSKSTRNINKSMKLRCRNASVAVIPFEINLESMDKTIETMCDVRKWNKHLKIVLIANRLDSDDIERDFNVKANFIELFREKLSEIYLTSTQKLIEFADYNDIYHDKDEKRPNLIKFDNYSNITLTYLRNSYSLCGIPFDSYDREANEYLLDLFKYKKDYETNHKDKKEDYEEQSEKLNIREMDFHFFRYLFYLTIKDGKTKDENEYYQSKDFVVFRNRSLDELTTEINGEYVFNDDRFKDFNVDYTYLNSYRKVIKDFAYIIHSITSSTSMKTGSVNPFFDFDKIVFPENELIYPEIDY